MSHSLMFSYLLGKSEQDLMQLLLDCSSLPPVISAAQIYGEQISNDLFYIGRTWCFAIHCELLKLGILNDSDDFISPNLTNRFQ